MSREYTFHHYLEKAAAYCAYQERSEQDVIRRLNRWELPEDMVSRIVDKLREDKFFDDMRFAESFSRGKHRQNRWGRFKILQGLYAHGISRDLAANAVSSLSEEIYQDTIRKLILSRITPSASTGLKEKARVFNFLLSKGYESDLIQSEWEALIPDAPSR